MEPLFCRFGVILGFRGSPACLIGIRPPMSGIIIARSSIEPAQRRELAGAPGPQMRRLSTICG